MPTNLQRNAISARGGRPLSYATECHSIETKTCHDHHSATGNMNNTTHSPNDFKYSFNNLSNASLVAEWLFFLLGILFCFVSIFGNGYVSYRLIKIIRVSRAIQTPIYLSLTISGFCTGVFCMPYMLYTLYTERILWLSEERGGGGEAAHVVYVNSTPYLNATASYTTTSYYITYSPYPYYSNSTEAAPGPDCRDNVLLMKMFDRIMYNISGTVFNITSRLLVWLMLLLSVDRYVFICLPYRIHLVKKQHYVIWILLSCLAVSLMTFAPFIFYYPEAIKSKQQIANCPAPLYQPYKPTFQNSYIFDNQLPVLLNTLERSHLMALFIVTVVLFLIVPICLNVILSFKVLYEVSKMKKVGRTTNCRPYPPPYSTALSKSKETNVFLDPALSKRHHVPLLRKIANSITNKFQGFQTKHQNTMIENKASFTMLVLSLFYIVTYFAWVLVWFSTIPMILNLHKENRDPSMIWIFLYHSKNIFAYNITNHYPQATFANAAFVPCLLGYSLHRGRN